MRPRNELNGGVVCPCRNSEMFIFFLYRCEMYRIKLRGAARARA